MRSGLIWQALILFEAAHKCYDLERRGSPALNACLGGCLFVHCGKELLYRYTAHWAKNINSPALWPRLGTIVPMLFRP